MPTPAVRVVKFSSASALKKSLMAAPGHGTISAGWPDASSVPEGTGDLPAGSNTVVFLSYSHDDESSARHLKQALARNGVQTWLASDELRPGERWSEVIRQRLRSASVLVLLIGRRPGAWTRYEWSEAVQASWDRGVPLMPVLLEGAEAPEFLRAHQAFRVRHDSAVCGTRSPDTWARLRYRTARHLKPRDRGSSPCSMTSNAPPPRFATNHQRRLDRTPSMGSGADTHRLRELPV